MKIRILFFALFLSITTLSFGQQYYVGASIGWHQDIFTMSETNKKISNDRIYLYNPSANLNFGFLFKNNIELSLGVGFYLYRIDRYINKYYLGSKMLKTTCVAPTHSAVTIPVSLSYNFNLWNNRLLFKVQSGLDFDVYFSEIDYKPDRGGFGGYTGSVAEWTYLSENARIPHFNILISNKVVLQYYTKFNMGIAIFGAYHAGLIPVWQGISGHFEWKSEDDPEEWQMDERGNVLWNQGSEIFDTKFNSNGSYWQFGIELGYRFGGKKKESTH
jgi:hypothetical protein